MNEKVKHIKGKLVVEQYLFASGLKSTVLRPVAFFENLDDPANWNPLKKGSIKFLTDVPVKLCACYDIGRAAAKLIADPDAFNGKIVDVCDMSMHYLFYSYYLGMHSSNFIILPYMNYLLTTVVH